MLYSGSRDLRSGAGLNQRAAPTIVLLVSTHVARVLIDRFVGNSITIATRVLVTLVVTIPKGLWDKRIGITEGIRSQCIPNLLDRLKWENVYY